MSIVLYHHPYSRAANVIWMLEELGIEYELRFVDFTKGENKKPEFLALNPMGKLPTLTDGDVVVTESAAIGLYLADRYASGRLAPALTDPARGTYFRWSLFAPSVIEPGAMAKAGGWDAKPSSVGWGTHEAMLASIEAAISQGPYLLGETFSMADVIFGGTVLYMLRFGMLEKTPALSAYAERLSARPAHLRSDEINARVRAEHGLK